MTTFVLWALDALAGILAVLIFLGMVLAILWGMTEPIDPESVAPVGAYYGDAVCLTSSC